MPPILTQQITKKASKIRQLTEISPYLKSRLAQLVRLLRVRRKLGIIVQGTSYLVVTQLPALVKIISLVHIAFFTSLKLDVGSIDCVTTTLMREVTSNKLGNSLTIMSMSSLPCSSTSVYNYIANVKEFLIFSNLCVSVYVTVFSHCNLYLYSHCRY